VIDGLTAREVGGKESPLSTTFNHIKNRVDDLSTVYGRSAGFAWRRNHRFKDLPLFVGETGFVKSDFHRFNGAALLLENSLATAKVKTILQFFLKRRSFQTSSNARPASAVGGSLLLHLPLED
jgi:hypothetical protein